MPELGYVEGKNLVIEWRFADGELERLPGLAAELARLKVDVIVAGGSPAISAAQKATSAIPIVLTPAGDPVGSGFVEKADAVIVGSPTTFAQQHRQIAELAFKYQLPSMFQDRMYVEAGGLMSYGTKFTDLYLRSATYVDKILKGAKPSDLPVVTMRRQLRLTLLGTGQSVLAELLDDEAPSTAAHVWNRLPIEGPLVHAQQSGAEVFVLVADPIRLAPENLVQLPLPGELLYFYLGTESATAGPEPIAEIAFIYGRGVTLRGAEGVPAHLNMFARVPGDWKYDWRAFADGCRAARGAPVVLRIERVVDGST